jgi:hypothetical protein
MKLAKIIMALGAIAMTAIISYAFMFGDLAADGAIITSLPWGLVSLVDLYVCFTIFSVWVVYREKSILATVLWIAAIMILGAFAIALYALLALQSSRGDWKKFWMGKNA